MAKLPFKSVRVPDVDPNIETWVPGIFSFVNASSTLPFKVFVSAGRIM